MPTSWASRSTSPPRRRSRNADRAEAGHARPRDQGARGAGDRLPARQRLSPRSAVREARSCRSPTDSRLEITPADIGPTSVVMEGIVGAGVDHHAAGAGAAAALGDQLQPRQAPALHAASATTTAFPSSTCSRRSSVSRAAGSTRAIWSRRACRSARSCIRTSSRARRRRSTSRCTRGSEGRHPGGARSLQPQGLDAARQLHHLEAVLEDRRAAAEVPHQPRRAGQRAGRSSLR